MRMETYIIVTRIESYTDPKGGRGKKIEFATVERKDDPGYQSPEVKMVREMVNQLKNMGMLLPFQQIRNLKMVLYLMPDEEKSLGIVFNVNNVYKMTFENGSIKFIDVTDQFYFVE